MIRSLQTLHKGVYGILKNPKYLVHINRKHFNNNSNELPNETTKIDAILTEMEIDKIVGRKKELENSKNKGTISMNLKTNSGILKINLRILSPNEKAILITRVLLFIAAVSVLANYCFIQTTSYFIFAGGLFALSFLITPIYMDIVNFTKDTFKSKT